jgi:hypothetical protein
MELYKEMREEVERCWRRREEKERVKK